MKKIAIMMLLIMMILSLGNVVSQAATNNNTITIVLDPGHGGNMTGAANNELKLVERDINLTVARYLKQYLEQYDGINIIMTHNGDLPSDYELEIVDRAMVARNNNADLLVSLHFNDSTDKTWNGAEVYVTANTLLPKYNQECTKLGNKILQNISALGVGNRGVKTRLCGDTGPKWEYSDGSKADYYGVIRYSMKGNSEDRGVDLAKGEGIPAILIEHCFMNGIDAQFINSDAKLKAFAIADGKAIVDYYGLRLKTKVVQSITLNTTDIAMIEGNEFTLTANVEPSTAENKKVTWSSSNKNVATVDSNGVVKGVGEGTAVITATTQDKGLTAKANVSVEKAQIYLSTSETTILAGNTLKILSSVSSTLENKNIMWSSSDTEIATVDSNGLVTTIKEGEVTIKAILEYNQLEYEVKITVKPIDENQTIEIKDLKQENGLISKIEEKMTVSKFEERFKLSDNLKMVVTNTVGETPEFVGSGNKVTIINKENNEVIQEYICVMYADVNGDGKISAMDYTLIKNHIMDVQKISNSMQSFVADVNGDGKISAMDYTLIKNHIMDVQKIGLK